MNRAFFALLAATVGACTGRIAAQGDPATLPPAPGDTTPRGGSMTGPAAPADATTPTGMVTTPAPGAIQPAPSPPPASPGAAGEPSAGSACAALPTRIWKLTPDQFTASLFAMTRSRPPVPTDERRWLPHDISLTVAPTAGFTSRADLQVMTMPHLDNIVDAIQSRMKDIVAARATFDPCLATPEAACLGKALDVIILRAYRRPPEPGERERFVALFSRELALGAPPLEAFEHVVRALLMSPRFLYRTEMGAADGSAPPGAAVKLTPHETASALSYLLSDAPPDEKLMAAAASGALTEPGARVAEARRLMARTGQLRLGSLGVPAQPSGLIRFLAELFETMKLGASPAQVKSRDLYKSYDPSSFTWVGRDETLSFFEEVMVRGDAKLATLLTAEWSMIDTRLAGLYGVPATGLRGYTYTKTSMPPGQRAGVLTQFSMLAALAGEDEGDPILRGKFVRQQLLCEELPPPPPDVNAVQPKRDGVSTMRERLAKHGNDPACVGCHRLLDPVGFAFEHYDAIGAFRTMDAGKPIDASGEIVGHRNGRFKNAIELARILSDDAQSQTCFLSKLQQYTVGYLQPAGQKPCVAKPMWDKFVATGGDLREALLAYVGSDDFVTRVR